MLRANWHGQEGKESQEEPRLGENRPSARHKDNESSRMPSKIPLEHTCRTCVDELHAWRLMYSVSPAPSDTAFLMVAGEEVWPLRHVSSPPLAGGHLV